MALPLSKFIAFEIHGIQIYLLLASLQPNWIGSQKSTEPKYPSLRVLERSVLPDGGRLCALWPLVASRSLVGLLRTPQCTSHSYQLWSHGGYQGNNNLKQRKKCKKYSGTKIHFSSYEFETFDLFYAVKTMLSKLANLWYLLSKKVNLDDQYWLRCSKKAKNHRLIGVKINVARFARNMIKWDFLMNFKHCDLLGGM